MFATLYHLHTYRHRLLKQFLAAIAIFIFALGNLETMYLHPLLHIKQDAQLHSAANESNACHLTVFHNNKSCPDKEHIYTHINTCTICKMTVQQALSTTFYKAEKSNLVYPSYTANLSAALHSTCSVYLPSRAPPFMV